MTRARTDNPEAVPLEQKCKEPGRWVIEGYMVNALYQGRSRNVMGWYIANPEEGDDIPTSGWLYLDDVRDWIRNHRA